MLNTDIFKQQHAPHTSRFIEHFDSIVNTGSCAVGEIKGLYRTLPALVTESATELDQWRIVNLVSKKNDVPVFDAVAVLGAVDNDQASELAMLQCGRMFDAVAYNVVPTNTHGLMRHLSVAHYHAKPSHIQPWQLAELQDVLCADKPMWDGLNLMTHDKHTVNLLLDMQRHDDNSQLLAKFDGLKALLESIGAEEPDFDALIVDYQYLDKLMATLHKSMQSVSKVGVQVSSVETSKPFKRNRVAQVAVSYAMDDGQSATILFHNPDNTPAKLAPTDTLISWKILLNNRDVTGAIQPNQGEGIELPVLAGRIMKLVNQNSARFKRTQAKKGENVQLLTTLEQSLADKNTAIAAIDTEIATLQGELDQVQTLNAAQEAEAARFAAEAAAKVPDDTKKLVTKGEAENIYAALSDRHRWLTGGTTEEFYSQNYPDSIQEELLNAQALLARPFNKVASEQIKENLEKLVQNVTNTIEKWQLKTERDIEFDKIEAFGKGKDGYIGQAGSLVNADQVKDSPPGSWIVFPYAKGYAIALSLPDGKYTTTESADTLDKAYSKLLELKEAMAMFPEGQSGLLQFRAYKEKMAEQANQVQQQEPTIEAPVVVEETEIVATDPEPSSDNQDDMDYLNSVISGSVDFADSETVENRLEEIGNRIAPDQESIFEQAVEAYAAYQVNQAAGV